jgi:hypothetical protein
MHGLLVAKSALDTVASALAVVAAARSASFTPPDRSYRP